MDILLRFLIWIVGRGWVKEIEEASKNPFKAQEAYLLDLMKRNQETAYGKKYHFDHVKSINDFQRYVPLVNYEKVRRYVEEMALGEKSILTQENPLLYAMTSGTTGAPKYIPITPTSRAHKAKLMRLWIYHCMKDHPGIFRGKILSIVSPEIEGYTPSGIPFGAESGHAYSNLPKWIHKILAVPIEVFNIEDYDARYYVILRLAIEQNISMIATVNPSTIVLLSQLGNRYSQLIIDDIMRGTITPEFEIEKDIRALLESRIEANPKRASQLRKIIDESGGDFFPKHYWPKLKLISCWKGGTVGLYLKNFPKYFGPDVPVRDFGYLASEVRGSIVLTDKGQSGVLAITSNFFEFVPESQVSQSDKEFLTCDQLEVGERYYVYITNENGLYRYNMDDLIVVTGLYHKSPMIEFIQKGLGVTSITGEKLYESQVVTAVDRAVSSGRLQVEFFATTVEYTNDETPHYTFLVEFQKDPSFSEKYNFLRQIDTELSSLNVEYENKRKSKRLRHPNLKVIKPGGFRAYRKKKVLGGVHDGQFKSCGLTSQNEFSKNFEIVEVIKVD
ncbi:GH3 auxin-responsive promoter family protein [PVC group bacterium]|nr:GH3 auxin-responsive promoter family protein [PVC group bacterium]